MPIFWCIGARVQAQDSDWERNAFFLGHYVMQPGLFPDLATPEGWLRLPELASAFGDPLEMQKQMGLGFTPSFINFTDRAIDHELIPVFEEPPPGAVSPVAENLKPLQAAIGAFPPSLDGEWAKAAFGENVDACSWRPSQAPGDSDLPEILELSSQSSPLAVIALEPSPANPDLWVTGSRWTALVPSAVEAGRFSAIPMEKGKKSKFKPRFYSLGPVTIPVGFDYKQHWRNPSGASIGDSDLSLRSRVDATDPGGSYLDFRISGQNPLRRVGGKLQYVLIARPFREQALTGVAWKKKNQNLFLGYETRGSDPYGQLIVQVSESANSTGGARHTYGLITRLGQTNEATGAYQLHKGGLVANASVTPIRIRNNAEAGQELSSEASFGASFGTNFAGSSEKTPVRGFVNVSILREWAKKQGISGEIAAGLEFPRSGTSMYLVLPIGNPDRGLRVKLTAPLIEKKNPKPKN